MSDENTLQLKRSVTGMIWCAALLYVVFVFTLTHMSLDGFNEQPWFKYSSTFWLDKIIQCMMYSGLVGLLGCAMFPLNSDPVRTVESLSGGRTLVLFLIVAILAVIDENTQPYFGRNCEVMDIFADIVGIIPGFCIFLVLNEARHMVFSGEV